MTTEEIADRTLQQLVTQKTIKQWYSTVEVAEILGKAEFTVREPTRDGEAVGSRNRMP